jgi:GAF domain-containing protein
MSQGQPEDQRLLKQVARQKALLAVVTKIRETLDLEQILQATAREVCQLLEASRVGIYRFLIEDNWEEGEYIAEALISPYNSLKGLRLRDECFAQKYRQYYEQGRCWVVNDISQLSVEEECYRAILKQLEFQANIVVPLLQGEKLWGLLSIHQCEAPRVWQPEEIEFAQALALHLGVAIQQAALLTQQSRQAQHLQTKVNQAVQRQEAIAAVIDKIRHSLDLETIFATATEEIRQLLGVDRVTIYRFNPDWSGEFVVESMAEGWLSLIKNQAENPEQYENIGECVSRYHSRTVTDTYLQETQGGQFSRGEAIHLSTDIYASGFSPCYVKTLESYQARAYIISAIYQGEEIWGLLAVFDNRGLRQWQNEEIDFLKHISNQLGIGIQQAQLLAESEQDKQQLQTALTQELQKQAQIAYAEAEQERALGLVIEKIRQTLDLNTIFQTTVTEVLRLLEADRVSIFESVEETNWREGVFICEAVQAPFDSILSARVYDRCFGDDYAQRYQEGAIQALEDIETALMSDCHRDILRRFQVRANLIIPLLKGAKLWGLLCIHQCSSPREWQSSEIEFGQKIALHLGVALQQSKLLQEAREHSHNLQNALAQVQAQKEEQMKLAQRERAVFQVIDKIRRTLDLETIFETTATEVRQLLGAERVAVFRFAVGWQQGEIVSEDVLAGFSPALGAQVVDHCFGEHHTTYYQNGKIFALNDIYQGNLQACYRALLERFQVRANLVAPLLQGDYLWGLLCIHQCSTPRVWQESEKEFIGKIATNLGIALQQAELLSETQKRSQELQGALAQMEAQSEHLTQVAAQERALARVIEQIRQTLNPEVIFQTTTYEVRQILKCDRVVVYRFYEDWSGEFLYESLGADWTSLTWPPGIKTIWEDTYLQETQGGRYRNHEILAIDDITQANLTQCHIDILQQFQAHAFVVAPVFVGDRLWGLLGVYQNTGPRRWKPAEISLIAQIGNQLGVGVYQAQLLSQKEQQSQMLQTTLADLNAIVDNLADGLLVSDIFGRITRSNLALLRLFNLEDISLAGKMVEDIFPDTLGKLIRDSQRSNQDVMIAEVPLGQKKQGQAQTTSIIKQASDNEGLQCLGTVMLIRDVTLEREINRMKTEFLANVSHELRTPLTSVLGFASLIQEKLEETIFPRLPSEDTKMQKTVAKVRQNIDIIVSEAERLTALIADVLDIAQMESGRIKWQIQPISPVDIVERAILGMMPLFNEKTLNLKREFDSDLPLVLVDEDRLIQVVINLLSNAIKFSSEGTITCRILDREDYIEISVSDTGIGIKPEDTEAIFERFNQVGNFLTNKPAGAGLGLPICKQVVEHYGGKIWVESQYLQGSTFHFTIPVQGEAREIAQEMNDVESLFKKNS